jgi:hypothetical protein
MEEIIINNLREIKYKYELYDNENICKDSGIGTIYIKVDDILEINDIKNIIRSEIETRLPNLDKNLINKSEIIITSDKNKKLYNKIENNKNLINNIIIGGTYSIFLLSGLYLGKLLFNKNDSI